MRPHRNDGRRLLRCVGPSENGRTAPLLTRQVQVRILTSVDWMDALLELPKLQDFFSGLEHPGAFLQLASLAVEPSDPADVQDVRSTTGREVEHDVSCFTTHGVLRGCVRTFEGVRLPEYLLHPAGFIVLREATLERSLERGERTQASRAGNPRERRTCRRCQPRVRARPWRKVACSDPHSQPAHAHEEALIRDDRGGNRCSAR